MPAHQPQKLRPRHPGQLRRLGMPQPPLPHLVEQPEERQLVRNFAGFIAMEVECLFGEIHHHAHASWGQLAHEGIVGRRATQVT